MAKKSKTTKRAPGKSKAAARPAAKKVSPVPPGYHTVTPYLTLRDAAKAIDFYKKAFGASVKVQMLGPDGKTVMHAELKIGDSIVMMSEESPQGGTKAPSSLGGTTGSVFLYVPNVDATFKRAVDAGAKVIAPMEDAFWGDRYGVVEDPFGHIWGFATHQREPSEEEMKKAMEDMAKQMAKPSK